MNKIDSSNDIIAKVGSEPYEDHQPNTMILSSDKAYTVTPAKKENKPSFMLVGNGRKNNSLDKGTDIMDFIKLMTHMTPQELFVIEQIKDNLIQVIIEKPPAKDGKVYKDYYLENIAFVKMSPLSNADIQKFKTGFKRLSAKNIVRRTKRSHYIFNPSFIVPTEYEETLKQWNKAEKKESKVIPPPVEI